MASRIPQFTAAGTLTGAEVIPAAQLSTTVTKTATTLSAQASDNSYNDSGSGLVAAGFAVGDAVRVTGFTGNAANNINCGIITALTTGKMTIGGTDGDVIVDDAAGESVTITKWVTRRVSVTDIVATGSGDVVGPASSVDGEIALFDSTTGKLIKRASTTGFVRIASGVLTAVDGSNDDFAQRKSGVWTNRTAAQAAVDLQGTGTDVDAAGFRGIPQNPQAGNYTIVAADAGKHIFHASGDGSGDTYTIPANGSVAFEVGTTLTFANLDSNSVSIAITTDTMYLAGTGTTGTRTLAQYGVATAIKVTSTSWIISGTGLT